MIGEVFEALDGDPRRRGTITDEHPLPVQPLRLSPPPVDHPAAVDVPLVATRTTDLLVARDLGVGLGALYGTSRDAREAIDAIRDHELDRRRG